MAAFISVGVIVAAALLTAGMIITADIRSRFALGAAAGHSLVVDRIRNLIDESDTANRAVVIAVLRKVVDSMEQSLRPRGTSPGAEPGS